jgi:hypothetical protein
VQSDVAVMKRLANLLRKIANMLDPVRTPKERGVSWAGNAGYFRIFRITNIPRAGVGVEPPFP